MKQVPVKDMDIKKAITSNELVKQFFDAGGFTAKKVAKGVDILENMVNFR